MTPPAGNTFDLFWAGWDRRDAAHKVAYERLLEPDKRFFVAGDQISYLPGWMEGALLAAEHVIRKIRPGKALAAAELPEILSAPSAADVTGSE